MRGNLSAHCSGSAPSGGVGLFGLLFVVFLVMKLVEVEPVASWSWWWVTAPLWGPMVLVILAILLVVAWICRPWAKDVSK